jgi:DNA (cytosine-5)-methyltransferase 1
MKAISLFSGQGGLDIGIENAGYEVLCAIENNKFACETLRQNRLIANMKKSDFVSWFESHMGQRCFASWSEKEKRILYDRLAIGVGKRAHFSDTEVIEEDIRKVDADALMKSLKIKKGQLDLIMGGPPCQSFSRSGKRESIEDERGQLFLDFARFVNVFRPRWFIFENVKGITMTKTNVPVCKCRECKNEFTPAFSEYLAHNRKAVPCNECGSHDVSLIEKPDIRGGAVEIIVSEFESLGYKCETFILDAAAFGAPQFRERFFIVGSRDGEKYSQPVPTRIVNGRQADFFSGNNAPVTLWEALFKDKNPYHHPNIDPEKAVLWVKNVVRPHDEPVTWTLHRPAPTIGAHQSAKLAIAPFGVPEKQIERQQWHTLGRRQGDTPPVPVVHTYLSDEDLLKLQTFPSYWFVAGTRMERAFQIGNAVPPVLAEAVALGTVGKKNSDRKPVKEKVSEAA